MSTWWPVAVPEARERSLADLPERVKGVTLVLDDGDTRELLRASGLPPSLAMLAGRVMDARWASDDTLDVQLTLLGPFWGPSAGPLTDSLLEQDAVRLMLHVAETERGRPVYHVLIQPRHVQTDQP